MEQQQEHLQPPVFSPSLDCIGLPVDPMYQKELRQKVASLLNFTSSVSNDHSDFCGTKAVIFEKKHLTLLENDDYFVHEKSKGTRYLSLMMVTPKGPATFMIDRKNTFFYVQVPFPIQATNPIKFQNETLLDGELVLDKVGDKDVFKYIVCDLMAFNGTVVTQRSFTTRLGILHQDVIKPYKAFMNDSPGLLETQVFRVEMKRQEKSYGLNLILDNNRDNDGLIFTPVKIPYIAGTSHKLLKWRPPDKNTVDFKLKVVYDKERKPHYQLMTCHNVVFYKFFDHLTLESELADEWRASSPDGKFAEFRYDPEWKTIVWENGYSPSEKSGGWRFIRFREDIDRAFDDEFLAKIIDGIKDGVTIELLLSHMERIRFNWKEREKMQHAHNDRTPRTERQSENSAKLSSTEHMISQSYNQPNIHRSPVRDSRRRPSNTEEYSHKRSNSSSTDHHLSYNPCILPRNRDEEKEEGVEQENEPNFEEEIEEESSIVIPKQRMLIMEEEEEEIEEESSFVPPVLSHPPVSIQQQEQPKIPLPTMFSIPLATQQPIVIPKDGNISSSKNEGDEDDYDGEEDEVSAPSFIRVAEETEDIVVSTNVIDDKERNVTDSLPHLANWQKNEYLPLPGMAPPGVIESAVCGGNIAQKERPEIHASMSSPVANTTISQHPKKNSIAALTSPSVAYLPSPLAINTQPPVALTLPNNAEINRASSSLSPSVGYYRPVMSQSYVPSKSQHFNPSPPLASLQPSSSLKQPWYIHNRRESGEYERLPSIEANKYSIPRREQSPYSPRQDQQYFTYKSIISPTLHSSSTRASFPDFRYPSLPFPPPQKQPSLQVSRSGSFVDTYHSFPQQQQHTSAHRSQPYQTHAVHQQPEHYHPNFRPTIPTDRYFSSATTGERRRSCSNSNDSELRYTQQRILDETQTSSSYQRTHQSRGEERVPQEKNPLKRSPSDSWMKVVMEKTDGNREEQKE